jgi:hypothetical protein
VLKKFRKFLPNIAVVYLGLLLVLIALSGGCKRGPLRSSEVAYVAVPQAVLRDRVAALYSIVGIVTNGQRLQILVGSSSGSWSARTFSKASKN